MALPNNYKDIKESFNNTSPPNRIPVKNYYDFEYNVYNYYNQYCASAKTTQNRRIQRNYQNNLLSIKEYNRNPFINNQGKKFNFLYTYAQNYRLIQNQNKSIDMYILINNCWCHMKHFSGENECKQFIKLIKSYALKNYY
jgi:hypothetical protein